MTYVWTMHIKSDDDMLGSLYLQLVAHRKKKKKKPLNCPLRDNYAMDQYVCSFAHACLCM